MKTNFQITAQALLDQGLAFSVHSPGVTPTGGALQVVWVITVTTKQLSNEQLRILVELHARQGADNEMVILGNEQPA